MLRRALDQGCQKLSDGTRIDISDVRLWTRCHIFSSAPATPCLWLDRYDVDGDFRETTWYRIVKQPLAQPLPAN
jgi:hypothetical protein